MSYAYNNEHLHSTNFKLVKHNIPQLKRKVDKVEVSGRNGSLYVDRESFEDRVIECEHVSSSFRESQYGALFDYFENQGELIFDTDTNLKWIVDYVELGDITLESNTLYKFSSVFHCQPFKKKVIEEVYSISNSSIQLNNTGVIECFPNFEIVPHDYMNNVTIVINGKTFTVHNVRATQTVYILGDEKNVIQGEKLLETSGYFPVLNLGENTVSTNESSKEIKIKMNERFA